MKHVLFLAAILGLHSAAYAQNIPAEKNPDATLLELLEEPENVNAAPVESPVLSLFFTPQQSEEIRRAQNIYLGKAADVPVSPGAPVTLVTPDDPIESAVVYYPQFTLSSILYHTPSDWAVWMDGKKFTPASLEHNELKLLEVNKESARFQWTPSTSQPYQNMWKKTPGSGIELRLDEKLIFFTLRPNQTLSSGKMRIVEGTPAPVKISLDEMSIPTPVAKPVTQAPPSPALNNPEGVLESSPVSPSAEIK